MCYAHKYAYSHINIYVYILTHKYLTCILVLRDIRDSILV
jgi:hypothetical protein